MADVIDYRIVGDDMQLVEIELDPGEGVRAEAGAMLYMEQGIQMDTGLGTAGVFGGFKRMITGESFSPLSAAHGASSRSSLWKRACKAKLRG